MSEQSKKVKITISVDPDFYPILQALPGVVGMKRDELVITAVREQYREHIERIAGLATVASKDDEEGSATPRKTLQANVTLPMPASA